MVILFEHLTIASSYMSLCPICFKKTSMKSVRTMRDSILKKNPRRKELSFTKAWPQKLFGSLLTNMLAGSNMVWYSTNRAV